MPHHQFSIITQKFPGGPFKFQEISRSCRHPAINSFTSFSPDSCQIPDISRFSRQVVTLYSTILAAGNVLGFHKLSVVPSYVT